MNSVDIFSMYQREVLRVIIPMLSTGYDFEQLDVGTCDAHRAVRRHSLVGCMNSRLLQEERYITILDCTFSQRVSYADEA